MNETPGAVLCRLCGFFCGKNNREYVGVFDENGTKRDLCSKISSCLQITISTNDTLPTIVCHQCCNRLEDSYEFFEKAAKVQKTLVGIFEPINGIEIIEAFEEVEYVDALTDHIDYPESILPELTIKEEEKKVEVKIEAPKPRSSELLRDYPWSCTICEDVLFPSHHELIQHFNNEHQLPPVYKCIFCEKKFDKYRSFTKHWVRHRTSEEYKCDTCDRVFAVKSSLATHCLVHTDERPHVCEICNKSFKRVSTLVAHRNRHAPDGIRKKFPCKSCDRVFLLKHSLISHEKMHKGELDFICDICGKSFVGKTSLSYHLSCHTSDKVFTCSICEGNFKTQRLLTIHSKIHLNIRPHHCDVCGKNFRKKTSLEGHKRIHTGVFPYSCEYCGKNFRFPGIYTVHKRQHTGEKPYSCKDCNHAFTDWPNYNKHMKRIHKLDTSMRKRYNENSAEKKNQIDEVAESQC